MDASIVGRDAVLDHVSRLLAVRNAVQLGGPAGIGKTAVWRSLLARAADAGWTVLSCAPTESETALPFAALADLLRPLARAVPALPAPQRVAAEVVLLASQVDSPVDERAVGAATLSLLESAVDSADGATVLVAVDDVPWLDPPSDRALRFALRRLLPRVALLETARTTDVPAGPLGLDGLTRIELTPLGVGALHHVLRARLGATLTRPLLARIARDAGGNPLLAIELARAVLRLPTLPLPGEDLPVAASMTQLLADALAALPVPSRDAVRLAALLSVPTAADLVAAGVWMPAFDAAEEAGLLEVTPTLVSFAHPVYAAAVRGGIPSGMRRRLHRALADAVADPDERARHLARCAVGPDAAVAGEVAAAAERQRARGAPGIAAELYDRAADLSPPDAPDDGGRRRLMAVRCRYDSGDYAAAGAAADAAATTLTGDLRAEALLLSATVAWSVEGIDRAVELAASALDAVRGDAALAGQIHAHLSLFEDDSDSAIRHAEEAIARLTGQAEDAALLSGAMVQLFYNRVRRGDPPQLELLERALALTGDDPPWLAGTVPAIWWRAVDDHDRARAWLHRLLDWAVARGDEPSAYEALAHLAETEWLAGRWTTADGHLAAALELGEQLGAVTMGEHWIAAMLDADRGRLAQAQAAAETIRHQAGRSDDAYSRRVYLRLAGYTALSSGRTSESAAHYGELAETLTGIVEPMSIRFEPDWVEACVGAGDLDTAQSALDRLAARHARLARPWTTLGLARGRVLVGGARGEDLTEALAELARARASVPADVIPLDRARCLLIGGIAHRRVRRKREAREALTLAAEEFDALGATTFAERARAELARIGGRPAAPTELTATEERVARLAAQGATNRVIADTLFMSPKTVEANLARVYRKLGIASRAELGAAMMQRASAGNP